MTKVSKDLRASVTSGATGSKLEPGVLQIEERPVYSRPLTRRAELRRDQTATVVR